MNADDTDYDLLKPCFLCFSYVAAFSFGLKLLIDKRFDSR